MRKETEREFGTPVFRRCHPYPDRGFAVVTQACGLVSWWGQDSSISFDSRERNRNMARELRNFPVRFVHMTETKNRGLVDERLTNDVGSDLGKEANTPAIDPLPFARSIRVSPTQGTPAFIAIANVPEPPQSTNFSPISEGEHVNISPCPLGIPGDAECGFPSVRWDKGERFLTRETAAKRTGAIGVIADPVRSESHFARDNRFEPTKEMPDNRQPIRFRTADG